MANIVSSIDGILNVHEDGSINIIGGALQIDGSTVVDGTNNALFAGLSVDSPTFVVDSVNHRIGIGTTSPTEVLEVRDGTVLLASTTTSPSLQIQRNDGSGNVAQAGFNVFGSSTNIQPRLAIGVGAAGSTPSGKMYIGENGDVGIGPSNPYKKLEVAGDIQLDATDANIWLKSGAAGTNGFINWTFNTDDTVHNKVGIDYDTRATTGFNIDAGYPITVDSTTHTDFRISGAFQGRLTTTGLGLGITAPTAKLHVVGNTRTDTLDFGDASPTLSQTGDTLKIQTTHGYTTIGASNTSYTHISTDRANFYFNKQLVVDTGVVQSYDQDLNLNRAGSATARLRLTSTETVSDQNFRAATDLIVDGNLTVSGTTTFVDTANLNVTDAVITLNYGQATPSNDIGMVFQRYSSPTAANYNPVFMWEESTDRFIWGTTTELGADNDIGLNTQWMTVTADGNVGIGTTNPVTRLHIAGGHLLLNNAAELRSKDTGGSQRTITRVNSSNELEYGWSGPGPVKFMGGGSYTERMRIHTNGNVGIGTDDPAIAKLQFGNNSTAGRYDIKSPSDNARGIGLGSYTTFSTRYASWDTLIGTNIRSKIGTSSSGEETASSYTASGGAGLRIGFQDLEFRTYSPAELSGLSIGSNVSSLGTTRFKVTTAGNVGIGTATPNGRLTITGGEYVNNVDGPNDLVIESSDSTGGGIRLTNNTNKNWFMYHGGSGSWVGDGGLGFVYSDGTTAASGPAVTFKPNGNVGIGYASPSDNIHILGSNASPNVGITLQSDDTVNATATLTLMARDASNVNQTVNIQNTKGNLYIDSNVGIGITNPSSKLDVRGSLGANGTAATPTAYFVNNQSGATSNSIYIGASTGIDWKIGKNVTGISNNTNFSIADSSNNRRLDIDGSGNVGIGTDAPSEKLHVEGSMLIRGSTSSTGISRIRFKNIYDTASLRSSYTNPSASTETYLAFHANTGGASNGTDAEQMRIVGNKVGIGTTNPYSALQVGGTEDTTSALLTIASRYGASGGGGPVLNFRSGHASNSNVWDMGRIVVTDDGNYNGRMYFQTSDAGYNSTPPTTKMTIKSTGSVGIGTTNPSSNLHVYDTATTGTVRIGGGNGTSNHRLFIEANATSAYIDSYGGDAYNQLAIEALPLNLNQSSGGNVNIGGNVGIGTVANSTAQLHIYEESVANATINRMLLLDTKFAVASIDSNDKVSIGFSATNSSGGNQTRDAIIWSYDDQLYLNTTGDASTTYIGSNTGYWQDYNVNGTKLGKISEISFNDGSSNWDNGLYHGIKSTDHTGNYGDDISINSYNDFTVRLDTNNNNEYSWFRVYNDTATNTGNRIMISGYDGNASLGKTNFLDRLGVNADGTLPEYKLDLAEYQNEDASTTGSIRIGIKNGNSAGTSDTQGPGIRWKPSWGSYTKNSAAILQIAEGNYFRSGLAFYTNGTADATTDMVERMRIDKDGNVGIGITNPADPLSIFQTNQFGIRLARSGHDTMGIALIGSQRLAFINYTDGNREDLVIEKVNGNVGIGTDAPEVKLDVIGQGSFDISGNRNRGNIIIGPQGSGANKWATLAGTHYNDATGSGNGSGNAGVMIIGSSNTEFGNTVYVGHGPYELNPATEIRLGTHTAPTHTTGGTTHLTITADGKTVIGATGAQAIGTSSKLQVRGGAIDITDSDSVRSIRFYQNTTFRSGIGPGNWTGEGSNTSLGMYASGGDISFHHNSGTPTVRISDEGHLGLERSDASSGVSKGYPKIVYPNVHWSASGTSTGQVKIKTPGNLNNYDMIHMEITVYEYNSMNASTIIIGGHNWTSGGAGSPANSGWHNYGVKVIGTFDKPIRLTQDAGARYITLGDTNSSWTYGIVSVSRVMGSKYYSTALDWAGDWAISQVTSASYTSSTPDLNTSTSTTLATPGNLTLGNGFTVGRSTNDGNFKFKSATTGAAGMALFNSSNQFMAQIYGDGTAYGFLDSNWGGWDIRKITNGAMQFNGNTNYWLQPESLSVLDTVAINETAGGTMNNPLTIGNTNTEDFIKFRTNTTGQGQQAEGTGISWTWNSSSVYTEEWAAVRAIFPGNGDAHLTFSTKPTGGGSIAERMRVSNNGNVGIGTSSPNSKLEVATSDNVNNYSDGAIQVVSSSPLAFVAPSNLNPSLNRWGFTLREGGEGHFGIRDYRQASTRFTIDESGNVGIGPTVPEVKLEVNGGADGSVVFGGRSNGGNGNNRRFNLIAYADGGGANYGGGLKIQTRDSVNVFHDRITVQSNGNVGIGITTPSAKFEVSGTAGSLFSVTDSLTGTLFSVSDASGIPSIEVDDTSVVRFAEFSGNVLIGTASDDGVNKLQVDGGIMATGDVTAYASSDSRLKTNLEPITDALDKVNSLTGYTFNWNELARGKTPEVREAGVIAQDVEQVLPEITTTRDDGYMAVNYEKLVPLLIEAIKELTTEVEELKRK